MKIEEIRSKTDEELAFELEAKKKQLFELRFQSTAESSSNPAQIRVIRRGVARLHTVLHERRQGIRGQQAIQS